MRQLFWFYYCLFFFLLAAQWQLKPKMSVFSTRLLVSCKDRNKNSVFDHFTENFKQKPILYPLFETNLCSSRTLFHNHFLPGALCCWRVKYRRPSWSVRKSMSGHVFAVCFPDDAEGSCVSVRYICDWVSVQRGLVGNRTNLLDGHLRTRLGAWREGDLKRFVVTEGYISAGAQASGRLLGRCGGILRCSLGNVLVQPLGIWQNQEYMFLNIIIRQLCS